MTKGAINKRLKEIRRTLSWVQQQVNHNKVEDLGRDTFEDLMCLASELYHDYANEYDPE